MFTVLAEQVEQDVMVQPLPFSLQRVRSQINRSFESWLTLPDAKQARDLIGILAEAKQQIDPRLAEMGRYSGGGGGSRYGRGGHRGGRGGGGGGFTASNAAPLGRNSRW